MKKSSPLSTYLFLTQNASSSRLKKSEQKDLEKCHVTYKTLRTDSDAGIITIQ
jgi:hypothetical protein